MKHEVSGLILYSLLPIQTHGIERVILCHTLVSYLPLRLTNVALDPRLLTVKALWLLCVLTINLSRREWTFGTLAPCGSNSKDIRLNPKQAEGMLPAGVTSSVWLAPPFSSRPRHLSYHWGQNRGHIPIWSLMLSSYSSSQSADSHEC